MTTLVGRCQDCVFVHWESVCICLPGSVGFSLKPDGSRKRPSPQMGTVCWLPATVEWTRRPQTNSDTTHHSSLLWKRPAAKPDLLVGGPPCTQHPIRRPKRRLQSFTGIASQVCVCVFWQFASVCLSGLQMIFCFFWVPSKGGTGFPRQTLHGSCDPF